MGFSERLAAGVVAVLSVALAGAAHGQWFQDVTSEVGITFRHEDGRSGEKFYPETTASGGGWLDADGDGDLDLYLLNGAETPGRSLPAPPRNALYENLGRPGAQGRRLVDVSESAGVDDAGYGMGLCAGDVDADGRLDFLVTNFGPDRLYRNVGSRGHGASSIRFEDVAPAAGVDDGRWSSSCAFGDVDGDGDLDLYVTHYVDFAYERNPLCRNPMDGGRMYCHPSDFAGVPDSLFINQGPGPDGVPVLRDEGARRGLAQGASEKGLGVVLSDLDGDGDLDVYVANDGSTNRLYVNDGKGVFEDHGLFSGAGLNARGGAEASMGIAVGALHGDGRMDLVLSHFALETHTLYQNRGGLQFDDATRRAGLSTSTYRQVGWGIALFDADNDGDLDLAVANGHMQEGVEKLDPALTYRQPNQLFENVGVEAPRFRDATAPAGAAWQAEEVSRGLAVGDWNDDGRLDVLVTNTNAAPQLLENRAEPTGHWLGVTLEGPAANPFAIGARVELRAGETTQVREVRSGGSFQSQSDLRLHFGLGDHGGPVRLVVRWPDGHEQEESIEGVDRYLAVRYRSR